MSAPCLGGPPGAQEAPPLAGEGPHAIDHQLVGQDRVLLATPEQDAPSRTQPRRQVGQDGRREPQRPQRHEIELSGERVVGAADCSIETTTGQRGGAPDGLEEGPLALLRLDEEDVELRTGRGEDEAREPGARPHVEKRSPGGHPGEPEQGLDEMTLDRLLGRPGAHQGEPWSPPTQLPVVAVEPGERIGRQDHLASCPLQPGAQPLGERRVGEIGQGRAHRTIFAQNREGVPPRLTGGGLRCDHRGGRSGFTGNMTVKQHADEQAEPWLLGAFDVGFLVGILVGEGHFGGDGRQPQVTLRMHTDHEALFRWLTDRVGGRLYGPYHHGGRSYYQWMARGEFLRSRLVPLLDEHLSAEIDGKAARRYREMKERYGL